MTDLERHLNFALLQLFELKTVPLGQDILRQEYYFVLFLPNFLVLRLRWQWRGTLACVASSSVTRRGQFMIQGRHFLVNIH